MPKEKENSCIAGSYTFCDKANEGKFWCLIIRLKRKSGSFIRKSGKFGLYAKKCIKRRFGIEIPDAEVGYIAMHIIASEFPKKQTYCKPKHLK